MEQTCPTGENARIVHEPSRLLLAARRTWSAGRVSLHTCGLLSHSLMFCIRGVEDVRIIMSFPHVVRALPWLAARAVILTATCLSPSSG